MSSTPRLLRIATTLAMAGLLTAATVSVASASTEAAKSGQSLKGTVSWTTVTTVNDDKHDEYGFGNLITANVSSTGSLKVNLKRDPRYPETFVLADQGSSYTGGTSIQRQVVTRSVFGDVSCTDTTTGSATTSGTFDKDPKTGKAVVSAFVLPGTGRTLGTKTKAMVLGSGFVYAVPITRTYAGSGNSPCSSFSEDDTENAHLSPNNTSAMTCYPAGTSKGMASITSGSIIGAWSKAKRAFIFTCTQTWVVGPETTTVTFTGTIKNS